MAVTADAELDTSVVGAFEELRGTFPHRAVFLRLIRAVQTVVDPVTGELQGNTLRLETVAGALEVSLADTGGRVGGGGTLLAVRQEGSVGQTRTLRHSGAGVFTSVLTPAWQM